MSLSRYITFIISDANITKICDIAKKNLTNIIKQDLPNDNDRKSGGRGELGELYEVLLGAGGVLCGTPGQSFRPDLCSYG